MDVDGAEIYQVNSPYASVAPSTQCSCVLCEYADDTGGALAYLKQMDTALGGRTDDRILSKMMSQAYDELFYRPLRERDIEVPKLTPDDIQNHFSNHDINPLRVLRREMVKLSELQSATEPSMDGGGDARQWAHLARMKMDLVRQYEQTDARTSRELPHPPQL
tara:strand:- start:2228 stop:2716 length:489 start_codon:yes stop_codon:yes gene_type:complete